VQLRMSRRVRQVEESQVGKGGLPPLFGVLSIRNKRGQATLPDL
jgi:hypothetical protein